MAILDTLGYAIYIFLEKKMAKLFGKRGDPGSDVTNAASDSGSPLFASYSFGGLQETICHYENTPIQIYRTFHLQKLKIFR